MKSVIIDARSNSEIETRDIERAPAQGEKLALSDGRAGIVKNTGIVKENLMQKGVANQGVWVEISGQ